MGKPNNFNAWSSLGGTNDQTDQFADTTGGLQSAGSAPMAAPKKKSQGLLGIDFMGSDPVTSLLTRGTWKGPGGEFKGPNEQNQFIDLRGGGRPMFNHSGLGMNWGAGADDYQGPQGQGGYQGGHDGPFGWWK